eukprot:1389026-Amphidinium_carterae.1
MAVIQSQDDLGSAQFMMKVMTMMLHTAQQRLSNLSHIRRASLLLQPSSLLRSVVAKAARRTSRDNIGWMCVLQLLDPISNVATHAELLQDVYIGLVLSQVKRLTLGWPA